MNSTRQWYSALAECGYNKDGSPQTFPLSSVIKDKKAFFWKFYFLQPFFSLFCVFYLVSHLPIYLGLPLAVATGFGLNVSAQKMLKWAPTDMKKIQNTVSSIPTLLALRLTITAFSLWCIRGYIILAGRSLGHPRTSK
jgi:hypothetical protein